MLDKHQFVERANLQLTGAKTSFLPDTLFTRSSQSLLSLSRERPFPWVFPNLVRLPLPAKPALKVPLRLLRALAPPSLSCQRLPSRTESAHPLSSTTGIHPNPRRARAHSSQAETQPIYTMGEEDKGSCGCTSTKDCGCGTECKCAECKCESCKVRMFLRPEARQAGVGIPFSLLELTWAMFNENRERNRWEGRQGFLFSRSIQQGTS